MEEDQRVSSDDARRDWRALLTSVEYGRAHVTITRYGGPAAVLVPVDWHQRAQAKLSEEDDSDD
jgi:prevent-host-death family protein